MLLPGFQQPGGNDSVDPLQLRQMRSMDLAMMVLHNGREREWEDFVWLLRRADERLKVVDVRKPPGSRLSMIEIALTQASDHDTMKGS